MDRLNSELTTHWTRINIGVVALTAALGGYGALWKDVLKDSESPQLHILVGIVGFGVTGLACLLHRILIAGKNWCDIAEARVVALEREVWEITTRDSIYHCIEYDKDWKHTLRMKPSITAAYSSFIILVITVSFLSAIGSIFCACKPSVSDDAHRALCSLVPFGIGVYATLICAQIVKTTRGLQCLCRSDCCRKATLENMTQEIRKHLDNKSAGNDPLDNRNMRQCGCGCKAE
jgi:hypothetical protein